MVLSYAPGSTVVPLAQCTGILPLLLTPSHSQPRFAGDCFSFWCYYKCWGCNRLSAEGTTSESANWNERVPLPFLRLPVMLLL